MNKGLNLNLKEVTVKEAEAKSYTTMEVAKYRLKLINRIENFLSSTNDKSFNTYNFIQEMKNIMNNILSYDFMNITSNTKDGKLEKLKKQFIETINCRLQDVASDMNNKYNDLQEDKYNKLQIPTRKNPVVLPTNKFKKGTKYLLTMITNIIDYYQFFASICEINQEFKVAHDIYNNLANMVKNTDGKEEIIKNFYNLAAGISEKCYKPNSTPDQQKQLADQCYKIAKEYELAYNLKKAIEYYSKAIGHYKKTDNNNTILIKSYKKISEMYLKNGDTQNAYKIFKKNGEYHKAMYCAIALNQPKNAEELIMKYTNLQTTPTKQNLKEAIEIYTAAQREDLVAEAYLLKHRLFSEPKVLCS
jgi:tetratricopeptide (TPR) repeat protein